MRATMATCATRCVQSLHLSLYLLFVCFRLSFQWKNECCWDFEFWIWLKFPMWICSILDALCGTLLKCTWLGSLSNLIHVELHRPTWLHWCLDFFSVAGGWMIPTVGSSASVFLFFLFFQVTVTNFIYQGQICFCEKPMWKQLVTPWWLLRNTIRLWITCVSFCMFFSALSCLDYILHVAFCVVMCIYMT